MRRLVGPESAIAGILSKMLATIYTRELRLSMIPASGNGPILTYASLRGFCFWKPFTAEQITN